MGVVIEDRRGFSFWSNFSIGIFKTQMPVVNNCYPERLYRIYIINAEFMLRVMWNIAVKFIDKRTIEKVVILNQDELVNHIDKDQLLKEYGGTLDPPSLADQK